MSRVMEIFKNTSWIMSAQIITSIFGFVWTILIARYLGVSDFGILTFAISFTGILAVPMDLGISTYITRELSRNPEMSNKYIGNMIPLKAFLSAFSFLLSLAILIAMGYSQITIEVTLIFTIQAIFNTMLGLFNGIFQAFEKMKFQSIGAMINSSLLLIGTLVIIFFNSGLYFVAIAYLTASLFTVLYLYMKSNLEISPFKLQVDIGFWKETLVKAIPFGLTSIFISVYFLIDTVMISFMKGDAAVGIYSSTYKIITVITTLYSVYNWIVFPLMSKLYTNSADLLKSSYERSVKYLLIIVLPIAIGISYYAEPIIMLIYGKEYLLASSCLRVLIWTVVFLFINGASTLLLNSSNREIAITKIYGIACLFNFTLNIFLISYLSYVGASIATVITELLICVIMSYIIIKTKYKPDKVLIEYILKIILSNIILTVVLYLANLSFVFAIPIAIVVYSIAIILTRTLDSFDINIIKEIIGRVKS